MTCSGFSMERGSVSPPTTSAKPPRTGRESCRFAPTWRTIARMLRLTLCAAVALLSLGGANDDGFRTLFDGKTLDGSSTVDPRYLSVRDGAITAPITAGHPLSDNRYLVWKGGEGAPGGPLAALGLQLQSRGPREGPVH